MLYKTEHNKNAEKNIKLVNCHRKNDFLEATMSQLHSNYYGFVKTRVRQQLHHR